MFEDVDRHRQCAFIVVIIAANSYDMFNANELKKGTCHLVDSSVGVQDVFATLRATPGLFKILTNFTLAKFDKLALLMAPTIVHHA